MKLFQKCYEVYPLVRVGQSSERHLGTGDAGGWRCDEGFDVFRGPYHIALRHGWRVRIAWKRSGSATEDPEKRRPDQRAIRNCRVAYRTVDSECRGPSGRGALRFGWRSRDPRG